MKSWRTSLAGISAILSALASAGIAYGTGRPIDFMTLIPAVLAGIGLLQARDASVSSEMQGIKPTTTTKGSP